MRPATRPLAFNSVAVRSSLSAQTGISHFAASVPADSSHKPLKKISKDERRSLLQGFVHQYKASNGGKFPSVTAAQKQVGGSYYVVKRILQEIQYESKTFASSNTDTRREECLPLPKDINVSSSKSTARARVKNYSNATATNIASEEGAISNSEANEGSSISISNEMPLSGEVFTPSTGDHSTLEKQSDTSTVEIEEVLHAHTVEAKGIKKEEATFEGPADINGSTAVVQNVSQETTEPDELERNEHEDQLQKGSNLWRNLRSFADGIISIWRKK